MENELLNTLLQSPFKQIIALNFEMEYFTDKLVSL